MRHYEIYDRYDRAYEHKTRGEEDCVPDRFADGDLLGLGCHTHIRCLEILDGLGDEIAVDMLKSFEQYDFAVQIDFFHTVIPSFPSSAASFLRMRWRVTLTRLSPKFSCFAISVLLISSQ